MYEWQLRYRAVLMGRMRLNVENALEYNSTVLLISTSRLMMAYGLGRNIAFIRTSLQSFTSHRLTH